MKRSTTYALDNQNHGAKLLIYTNFATRNRIRKERGSENDLSYLVLLTVNSKLLLNKHLLPMFRTSTTLSFRGLIKEHEDNKEKKTASISVTPKVLFNCRSAIGISEAVKFNEPHSGQGFLLLFRC